MSTCRCSKPDADPYACDSVDCEWEFSELNPFGGLVNRSSETFRVCECGWKTSVWSADDGSAEEELYRHRTTHQEKL